MKTVCMLLAVLALTLFQTAGIASDSSPTEKVFQMEEVTSVDVNCEAVDYLMQAEAPSFCKLVESPPVSVLYAETPTYGLLCYTAELNSRKVTLRSTFSRYVPYWRGDSKPRYKQNSPGGYTGERLNRWC